MKKLYLRLFGREDDHDHAIICEVDPAEILRLHKIATDHSLSGVMVKAPAMQIVRAETLIEKPTDGVVADSLDDIIGENNYDPDPEAEADIAVDGGTLFVTDQGLVQLEVYNGGDSLDTEAVELKDLGAGPLLLNPGDAISVGARRLVIERANWDAEQGYYITLPDGRNIKERVDGVTVNRCST